jgi:hypothetical protein
MAGLPAPLAYLLFSWIVVTAVLVVLLVYRTTLSTKEDDQLYLNKAEAVMMGGEQRVIIGKLEKLNKPILLLAVLSGVLLLATAAMWVYIGLSSF